MGQLPLWGSILLGLLVALVWLFCLLELVSERLTTFFIVGLVLFGGSITGYFASRGYLEEGLYMATAFDLRDDPDSDFVRGTKLIDTFSPIVNSSLYGLVLSVLASSP